MLNRKACASFQYSKREHFLSYCSYHHQHHKHYTTVVSYRPQLQVTHLSYSITDLLKLWPSGNVSPATICYTAHADTKNERRSSVAHEDNPNFKKSLNPFPGKAEIERSIKCKNLRVVYLWALNDSVMNFQKHAKHYCTLFGSVKSIFINFSSYRLLHMIYGQIYM